MANIKIADKPTLDQVKLNTETTNAKIGNTADSGASASTGSVNGKLNKIITDASTNMGYVMAWEGGSVTPSTSSVALVANSTITKRVGNFSFTHSGKAKMLIACSLSDTSSYGCSGAFYISTLSTTSPTVSSLESAAVGKVEFSTRYKHELWMPINISQLSAGTTYYIHVALTTTEVSTTRSMNIQSIYVSLSYATTTRCQSIIKKIQSGTTIFGTSSVDIEPVAIEKCLVIINDTYCYGGDSSWTQNTGYVLLHNKLLFFYSTNYEDGLVPIIRPVSWQVIEFY